MFRPSRRRRPVANLLRRYQGKPSFVRALRVRRRRQRFVRRGQRHDRQRRETNPSAGGRDQTICPESTPSYKRRSARESSETSSGLGVWAKSQSPRTTIYLWGRSRPKQRPHARLPVRRLHWCSRCEARSTWSNTNKSRTRALRPANRSAAATNLATIQRTRMCAIGSSNASRSCSPRLRREPCHRINQKAIRGHVPVALLVRLIAASAAISSKPHFQCVESLYPGMGAVSASR